MHSENSLLWVWYKNTLDYSKTLGIIRETLCGFNFHSDVILCFLSDEQWVTRVTDQERFDGHIIHINTMSFAARFSFSEPPDLPSVILVDGHDVLPPSLQRRGAVRSSVYFFTPSFNPRVADSFSVATHQGELAFRLAPGPISQQVLSLSNSINNILTDFCWETEAKSQGNYLKRY